MTLNEEYSDENVPGRLYTILPETEENKSKTRTFIDAHVHLIQRDIYSWLPDKGITFEGDWAPLNRDYPIEDLIAETKGSKIKLLGAVHINMMGDDPVEETSVVEKNAGNAEIPISIVGGGDLSSEHFEDDILKQKESKDFVGVRQVLNIHPHPMYHYVDKDYMVDPKWLKGLRLLKKYDISFDMQLFPPQMRRAIQVVDSNPDILFIINHCGMLADHDFEGWKIWKKGMEELGKRDNVVLKISGIATTDHYWTLESVKPTVYTCLDTFGIDKCMIGSNFPVDKLHGSYVDSIRVYQRATEDLSQSEQDALFVENARKFYRF